MIVKSSAKFLRLSPYKVREVINLIRGKDVNKALGILSLINRRPKLYVEKIIKSAVSSAKHKGLNENQLYISKIVCEEGPIWKRYKSAAFGRAAKIRRRTSNIKVELDLKT